MLKIPCVIFAGGKSSRMGEDKSLLPFGTYPTLLQYQHARLSQLFSSVYISCKNSEKFSFNANFLEEDYEVYAPTAGFVHTLHTLQEKKFFAISVDTPFIDETTITTLYNQDKDEEFRGVRYSDRKRYVFVIHTLAGQRTKSLEINRFYEN